jgi:hypothetical protein
MAETRLPKGDPWMHNAPQSGHRYGNTERR